MVDLEKIKYKPVSVRDLLVEMKDLSELMIDLAYSAALFHSRGLAEEVLELEKRLRQKEQKIEELEFRLDGVTSQIEGIDWSPVEEPDFLRDPIPIEEDVPASKISPKSFGKVKDNRIIRVPVSVKDIQKAFELHKKGKSIKILIQP